MAKTEETLIIEDVLYQNLFDPTHALQESMEQRKLP